MRYKLTGFIACTTILLGACTDSPPTPDPHRLTIDPFRHELWRQHLYNLTLIEDLSLTEVYGDQWKEYTIFCGYTDVASLAEDLGIPNAPFEKIHVFPKAHPTCTYLIRRGHRNGSTLEVVLISAEGMMWALPASHQPANPSILNSPTPDLGSA